MRGPHTIGPGLLLLAGCLTTPAPSANPDAASANPDAATASPDATPPDAEDPCGGGGCDQLLAVAMSGWSGPAGGGWVILRHDGAGGWDAVAESSGPDWDVYQVSWGDCCGPTGPDGVPDLLGAAFSGPHVSVLATDTGVLRGGIPRLVDDGLEGDGAAQALWLDIDGDLDVDVLTGRDALRAYVRDGTDWTLTELAPGSLDHQLAAGSWDDDAAVELAAAGAAGVHVFEVGAWTSPEEIDARPASDVAWCDVAGSAHPELFVQRVDDVGGENPIDLYPNLGARGAEGWLDAPVPLQAVTGRTTMQGACVDLDGDGGLDFVYLAYDGIKVRPHGVAGTSTAWSDLDFIVHDFEPVVIGGVVTGIFVVMNTLPEEGFVGQVIWLPNQSAAGVFGFGAAEPVYQADVAGHGLAWIEVPAGVLPAP